MSDLTNKQIKQILDGAPDGATNYDTHRNGSNYWTITNEFPNRNIDDLREILTLRERVAGLLSCLLTVKQDVGVYQYGGSNHRKEADQIVRNIDAAIRITQAEEV
jgi:hypothetical protein